MRIVVVVFLLVLLAMFSSALQARLKGWFGRGARRVFVVPALLTAFFWAVLWLSDGLTLPFALAVGAYTLLPAALVALNHHGAPALDFLAILALWLPVEFAAAARKLLAPHVHGLANETAQGTAVALALFLFLICRDLRGMKYILPSRRGDLLNPLLGFAVAAPVLVFLGLRLSFLGPFRVPEELSAAGTAKTFLIILVGVAIPEELLFRSLIQNRLMQVFGESNKSLLAAAVIFGAAHLNNGPLPLPNWRYMILATIAGYIYGKVFQKSSTVLSSAALHALVNTARRFFG